MIAREVARNKDTAVITARVGRAVIKGMSNTIAAAGANADVVVVITSEECRDP